MRSNKNFIVTLVVAVGVIAGGLYFIDTPNASPQIPVTPVVSKIAFPGAVGFGANTVGGRGGVILQVTSCSDSGPGSFREAVDKVGPRVVIFKVSCLIAINSPVIIKNPYITIFGQTGDFAIKRDGLEIQTHDVIIRGLRVRVGDEGGLTNSRDVLKLNSWNGDEINNVIIDHSSLVWGIDENISTSSPAGGKPIYNITFSNNIIAEGLHCSVHEKGCHSMGMLLFNLSNHVTVYKNLIASNWARNPFLSGVKQLDFTNNVIYGWLDYSMMVRDTNSGNIVNNYWKTAPYTNTQYEIMNEGDVESKLYQSGNWVYFDGGLSPLRFKGTFNWLPDPLFVGVPAVPAEEAYKDVLNYSGGIRDAVDARIVDNVLNSKGAIINSQNDVGGWPDYTGTVPVDSDNDGLPDTFEGSVNLDPLALAPSGYMWIEEWANSLIDIPKVQ